MYGLLDDEVQAIVENPPRLARARGLLIEEINLEPPRLTGDGRPVTYVLESRAT